MNTYKTMLAAAGCLTVCAFAYQPATAQMSFPEKCRSDTTSDGDMGMQGHAVSGMEDHQMESLDGMKAMNMNMMQGMMKKDPDVAFVCGMIAHHLGAISMAEVELKHGDNAEAKAKAQKIIDDQSREIEELSQWVEKEVR